MAVVDKELVKKMTRLAKVLGFWPLKNKIKRDAWYLYQHLETTVFCTVKVEVSPRIPTRF
jgi:hypothetical protein